MKNINFGKGRISKSRRKGFQELSRKEQKRLRRAFTMKAVAEKKKKAEIHQSIKSFLSFLKI